MLGFLNDPAWLFGTYGTGLQNKLFQTTYPNGTTNALDLLAFNLNRGHDHGLQTYINYVKQCFGYTILHHLMI